MYDSGNAGMAISGGRFDPPGVMAGDSPATKRETHVVGEMARLLKASEYIHQLLGELEQRMSVVTRPDGPSAPGTPKEPTASLVPLASGLAEVSARIEHAIGRIRSLTQRLEL